MKRVMGCLGIAFLFVLILSGAVFAATLNVPSQYQTIQSAINAAAWGDTVLVAPGEYVQSITLKAGVTLESVEGPEFTIIKDDGSLKVWGHAVTVWGANDSTISGFTIIGSGYGVNNGGYAIHNWQTSPIITNNVITGAEIGISSYYSSSVITGNIVTGNRVGINNSFSTVKIANNTISGNAWGGIANSYTSTTITNNIISGHQGYGIHSYKSSLSITFNDVWGNRYNYYHMVGDQTGINGNISADPLFTGYYYLQAGSPCIDAGTNDAPRPSENDLDGNRRVVDGNGDDVSVIDMGAYEFQTECLKVPRVKINSFMPDYLWPPSRKMIDVSVKGKVILPKGCTLLSASYGIDDEYSLYSREDALAVDANGNFTLTLQVEGWRDGGDIDGRHYDIRLSAVDEAGAGDKTLEVLVPHDQRN